VQLGTNEVERLAQILGSLRHLYAQMVNPTPNRDPAGMAKGLLGPSIEAL
jgi:hypothetical protein